MGTGDRKRKGSLQEGDKGWAEQSMAQRENAGAGLRVGKDEVRGDEDNVERRPRT